MLYFKRLSTRAVATAVSAAVDYYYFSMKLASALADFETDLSISKLLNAQHVRVNDDFEI